MTALTPLTRALLCVAGGNNEAHRRKGRELERLLHSSNDDAKKKSETQTGDAG